MKEQLSALQQHCETGIAAGVKPDYHRQMLGAVLLVLFVLKQYGTPLYIELTTGWVSDTDLTLCLWKLTFNYRNQDGRIRSRTLAVNDAPQTLDGYNLYQLFAGTEANFFTTKVHIRDLLENWEDYL